jgi:hypothetical protein
VHHAAPVQFESAGICHDRQSGIKDTVEPQFLAGKVGSSMTNPWEIRDFQDLQPDIVQNTSGDFSACLIP